MGSLTTMSLILLLLSLSLALNGCGQTTSGQANTARPNTEKVRIADHIFHLELAIDPVARERGLMGRDHIPDDGGMLFVFPDAQVGVQSFWMGHCLVDIDIIYLDRRGFITAMHRMKAQPPPQPGESDYAYNLRMPRYSSVYEAQFAIELQAGWLDRLNLKVEDKIELDLERLKAMAR